MRFARRPSRRYCDSVRRGAPPPHARTCGGYRLAFIRCGVSSHRNTDGNTACPIGYPARRMEAMMMTTIVKDSPSRFGGTGISGSNLGCITSPYVLLVAYSNAIIYGRRFGQFLTFSCFFVKND